MVYADLAACVLVGRTTGGGVLALEGVAGDVWRTLVVEGTPERTVTALERRYDVRRARLERDVGDLVEALLDRGLVVTEDQDAGGEADPR